MENKKDEYILVLAALLHDIGKITQRYGKRKNHASMGAETVKNIYEMPEEIRKDVSELIKNHHDDSVSGPLLDILKRADVLTAAHDRDDRDPDSIGAYKKETLFLESIFDKLLLENIYEKKDKSLLKTKDGKRYLPLISLDKFVEQISQMESVEDLNKILYDIGNPELNLKNIDNELNRNIKELKWSNGKEKTYINNLTTIIENYTKLVPSAFYYSEPIIPLSDHLKLTAAFSLCIYRNSEKFLLISGELSGIQDYIFQYYKSEEADDRAAKRLRGRSFSIYLLTDAIVTYILKELDLYSFNVITENAGNFLIVATYSEENLTKLERIRNEVERFFLNVHRGLGITFDWIDIKYGDLVTEESGDEEKRTDFRKLKSMVQRKVDLRKKRQGSAFILDEMVGQIENGEKYKKGMICGKCGLRFVKPGADICEFCDSEERIGDRVIKTKHIWKCINAKENCQYNLNFGNFSIGYKLDDSVDETLYEKGYGELNTLNELVLPPGIDHLKNRVPWHFILQANYVPKKVNGEIMNFSEISSLGKEKEGVERYLPLGLLKGDLDDFGAISSAGLKRMTLSKYMSVSFFTSFFFSVIINRLAEKYNVYIVYSGGDDITALGDIKSIIDFAEELYKSLDIWSNLHFSAGIDDFSRNFPLRRSINIANDYLEQSKKFRNKNSKVVKNSVTVFSRTVSWEDFSNLLEISRSLSEAISSNMISVYFPYLLLRLDLNNPYRKEIINGTVIQLPDPIIHYYITKNWRDKNENVQKNVNKEDLIKKITQDAYFKNIKIIANYSIFNKRYLEIREG